MLLLARNQHANVTLLMWGPAWARISFWRYDNHEQQDRGLPMSQYYNNATINATETNQKPSSCLTIY